MSKYIPERAVDDSMGAWVMTHPAPQIFTLEFPDLSIWRYTAVRTFAFVLFFAYLTFGLLHSNSLLMFLFWMLLPAGIALAFSLGSSPVRTLTISSATRQLQVVREVGKRSACQQISFDEVLSLDYSPGGLGSGGIVYNVAKITIQLRAPLHPIVLMQIGLADHMKLHDWLKIMFE